MKCLSQRDGGRYPNILQIEKEFYNATLKKTQRESLFDIFSNNSISCLAVQSHSKMTCGNFTLNRNNKWIDSLEHLVTDYIAQKHLK